MKLIKIINTIKLKFIFFLKKSIFYSVIKKRTEKEKERFYKNLRATSIAYKLLSIKDFKNYCYLSVSYKSPSFWKKNYKLKNNIPYVYYSFTNNYELNFVTTAQYGLSCYDNGEKKTFIKQVEFLDLHFPHYYTNFDFPNFNVKNPWRCGLAYAQIISVYLRAYLKLKNTEYLIKAEKLIELAYSKKTENELVCYTPEGYPWVEEYPSKPSSYVLNGFISVIISLYEFDIVSGNNEKSEMLLEYENTLFNYIEKYDLGYWFFYSLSKKTLLTKDYMILHKYQFYQLYKLSNDERYKKLHIRIKGMLIKYSWFYSYLDLNYYAKK